MSWGGFFKGLGKVASIAAPIVAAPFTGGATLALIGAGAGAGGGLLGGGGWKGALTGGALGAIPGVGGSSGLAKGAVAPSLLTGLKQAGVSAAKGLPTMAAPGLASRLIGGNAATPGIVAGGVEGAARAPGVGAPGGGQPSAGLPWWANLGIQAGGAVAGALAGRKATSMAQQRSPEELAALSGARGIGDQASRAASSILGESKPYMAQAGQYYQTLLRGSRPAMAQAVAGPSAEIGARYRGAERGLAQMGVRGAARDVAKANLNRQRASDVSGLITGLQPGAADALAKLGISGMQTAGPLLGTAGNIYGNLLGYGAENRRYARSEGEKTSKAIGAFTRDIGDVLNRPRGGGRAPLGSRQTYPNVGALPPGLPGMVPTAYGY